jgi:PPM family protein phosphatase
MAENQHNSIEEETPNDTLNTTMSNPDMVPSDSEPANPDADTAPLTEGQHGMDDTRPLDQGRVAIDKTRPLGEYQSATDATRPLDESRIAVEQTDEPPRPQEDEAIDPPVAQADPATDEVLDDAMEEGPGEASDSEFLGETTGQLDDDSMPTISPSLSVQGLAAAALRDVGRVREVNQDSVFAMLTTLPHGTSDMSVGLFIVADGMGGHQSGDIASNLAIRAIVRHVLSYFILPTLNEDMADTMQSLMVSAVEQANMDIWQHAQRYSSDMGTTCTAALMIGQTIYIAHVGDSRAYVLEGDTLRPVTTDHSAVGRLIELGQLEPSAAREHPLRNQLYRAIGQGPEVEVDFLYQPLEGVTHLLLCSDGLWDLVYEEQMVEAITRSHWPQDACHELIALANLNGGDDNISAVVVTFPVEDRLF